MSADGLAESREAMRAAITAAYGPEVMHDALETEEARSYAAARRELRMKEAAFRSLVQQRAQDIAADLSAMLPEGMRFEWK